MRVRLRRRLPLVLLMSLLLEIVTLSLDLIQCLRQIRGLLMSVHVRLPLTLGLWIGILVLNLQVRRPRQHIVCLPRPFVAVTLHHDRRIARGIHARQVLRILSHRDRF